jgi:hypothetical protein
MRVGLKIVVRSMDQGEAVTPPSRLKDYVVDGIKLSKTSC